MKAVTWFGLLVLVSSAALGQSWQWQNPRINGNNLNCVGSLSGNIVWASSEVGDILWSADAGQTWIVRNIMGGPHRKTIFTDGLHGWGVNEYWDSLGAALLHTTDGGSTWSAHYVMQPATDVVISDIAFVDSQHGWIVGYGSIPGTGFRGFMARTTDGGETWTKTFFENYFPDMIHFVTPLVGWMPVGDGNTMLMRTTDGGQHWNSLPFSSLHFTQIEFQDADNGWAIAWVPGGYGLYRTANGGQSWNAAGPSPAEYLYNARLKCWDQNTAWILNNRQELYQTTDGGAHWTEQVPCSTAYFDALLLTDAGEVTLAGHSGVILQTSNSGTDWSLRNGNPSLNSSFRHVDFADLRHGWAVGYNGIVHTEDGGVTWAAQTSDLNCLSVLAVDSLSIWVCRGDGELKHSTNGGQSWSVVQPAAEVYQLALAAYGSSHVWAASTNQVCHSADSGTTWNCYPLPATNIQISDMFFVDESNGSVVKDISDVTLAGGEHKSGRCAINDAPKFHVEVHATGPWEMTVEVLR